MVFIVKTRNCRWVIYLDTPRTHTHPHPPTFRDVEFCISYSGTEEFKTEFECFFIISFHLFIFSGFCTLFHGAGINLS